MFSVAVSLVSPVLVSPCSFTLKAANVGATGWLHGTVAEVLVVSPSPSVASIFKLRLFAFGLLSLTSNGPYCCETHLPVVGSMVAVNST